MPKGGKPAGKVPLSFRIPEALAAAYESYVEDQCLDRSLIVSMLLSKFLIERGFVVDDHGRVVKKGVTA